jgi:hypothetical protein
MLAELQSSLTGMLRIFSSILRVSFIHCSVYWSSVISLLIYLSALGQTYTLHYYTTRHRSCCPITDNHNEGIFYQSNLQLNFYLCPAYFFIVQLEYYSPYSSFSACSILS